MQHLFLLLFYLTTLQTSAQKTIPNSFFQLEQQDSLLPFYLYLKDGHFFFFCADEAQVRLLNYGEYKAEGEKLDFEPAIRAEGTYEDRNCPNCFLCHCHGVLEITHKSPMNKISFTKIVHGRYGIDDAVIFSK